MAPISDDNKGYGFIEYYKQACVEYAKQKMSTPEFKIDINAPTVSQADPKNGGESASIAHVFFQHHMTEWYLLCFFFHDIVYKCMDVHFCLRVKSLYVKKLPKTVKNS